jgi:MoaA/NifB/PqqE/SkfB family radical SAM enzyme
MTQHEQIELLKKSHSIIAQIDLDEYFNLPLFKRLPWLEKQLQSVHKGAYQENERILLTLTQGDVYASSNDVAGLLITNLQQKLNSVDISNFFIILLTPDDPELKKSVNWTHKNISQDPVSITHVTYDSPTVLHKKLLNSEDVSQKIKLPTKNLKNDYNSLFPIKMDSDTITDRQLQLLTESQTFCMYPWIHLHAHPTGTTYLCCLSEMDKPIGDCKKQTLEQIWNSDPIKSVRLNMVSERPVEACTRCYEQEQAGFFSGRRSANKYFGHYIDRVDSMQYDGTVDKFAMTYWDIRFSNLCNLSCRSCGHIFSSSWYQDQAKLAGNEWAGKNQVLNYAGRTKTDMWEQLIPHLDYVEQIYFAGGEPLMMEEHYNILDELERRGRFDVQLIYNTNFTHTRLKERSVFDYWRKFDRVAIGASLDAMGPRAEYIRKGTKWDQVERNREEMMSICPDVDFYISPTLSIMNALHIPDFHKNWVEKGFIRAQDLTINLLQDPEYYRVDMAPAAYKDRIVSRFNEHLEWLRPLDTLQRATIGFESAINFMQSTDNSHLINKFWAKTYKLDSIRSEKILEVIPELADWYNTL